MARLRKNTFVLGAVSLLAVVGLTACGSDDSAGSDGTLKVTLILKTTSSPYFVALADGAKEGAKDADVDLTVTAAKDFDDTDTQIQAIENAISQGQDGILVTPNGQPVIDALDRARQAGLKIIELDDVPDPVDAVDGIFATDNRQAGRVIGEWAAATLAGKEARIALLDAYSDAVIPLDYQRDQGFLEGMGIELNDPNKNGDEAATGSYSGGSYSIACNEASGATEDGGRTAIEKCLAKDEAINVVYALNEPAAAGAYEGLKAVGKENDVVIVAIDGGCDGIGQIEAGTLSATAQQYPEKMAATGVQALADLIREDKKPEVSDGLDFFDTGVQLVTDQPADGVESIDSAAATKVCWG